MTTQSDQVVRVAHVDRQRLRRNLNRTLLLGFFQVFLVIMPIAVRDAIHTNCLNSLLLVDRRWHRAQDARPV